MFPSLEYHFKSNKSKEELETILERLIDSNPKRNILKRSNKKFVGGYNGQMFKIHLNSGSRNSFRAQISGKIIEESNSTVVYLKMGIAKEVKVFLIIFISFAFLLLLANVLLTDEVFSQSTLIPSVLTIMPPIMANVFFKISSLESLDILQNTMK